MKTPKKFHSGGFVGGPNVSPTWPLLHQTVAAHMARSVGVPKDVQVLNVAVPHASEVRRLEEHFNSIKVERVSIVSVPCVSLSSSSFNRPRARTGDMMLMLDDICRFEELPAVKTERLIRQLGSRLAKEIQRDRENLLIRAIWGAR